MIPCGERRMRCYDLWMDLVEKAMFEDCHGAGSL